MAYWLLLITIPALVEVSARNLDSCGGRPADVFFLLDSSGSLSARDFEKELQFTKDVVKMFDTQDNNVRVGVATFSKNVTPQLGLGEYEDREDLLEKISATEYEGMGTNTGEALSYLHVKGMSPANVREGVPHVAIVLTDGMSQNPGYTLKEAEVVHQSGISVFVIGVGNQVDKLELEAIASDPADEYVFFIDNFDALEEIKEKLAIKACKVEPITPAPDVQNTEAAVEEELMHYGSCTPRHTMDLVFAVDTAAIGANNAEFVLRFIGNVSDHINMKTGGVSIATVSSGCLEETIDEDTAFDPDSVKRGLSKFESPKFLKMLTTMRMKAAKARRGTKHVGIVFMVDALSPRDFRNAQLERRRAIFQKTEIFVFGVGDRVKESQARELATEHGGYLHVYSFDSLEVMGTRFLYNMCIIGV